MVAPPRSGFAASPQGAPLAAWRSQIRGGCWAGGAAGGLAERLLGRGAAGGLCLVLRGGH
jgi:hypothetical protein